MRKRKNKKYIHVFTEMTQLAFPSLPFDVCPFVLVPVYSLYYVPTLTVCFPLQLIEF